VRQSFLVVVDYEIRDTEVALDSDELVFTSLRVG